MSQGVTGAFAINGTNISLPPTNGKWEDKDFVGEDGNGHPIYPAVSGFIMNWGLMSTSEFKQINDFYISNSVTGTVIADLPKWGDTDYTFYSYTGTILHRPNVGKYFNTYVTDVEWKISNIRVS